MSSVYEQIKNPEATLTLLRDFFDDNNITSKDLIIDDEHIIEHAYTLLEKLCDTVGLAEIEDEDEDITDGDYDEDNPMYSEDDY